MSPSARLAVIGDTQRTSRLEFIWPNHDAAQAQLFGDLAEQDLAGLCHVGDVVTWAGARRHWRRFDRLMEPLTRAGLAGFAVRGNHDYMPWRRPSHRFDERFPHLANARWFTVHWRGAALVHLDSNFSALGRRRVAAQSGWLQRELYALRHDPSVSVIVGLWHHPPFTNSRTVGPSRRARELFGVPFSREPKAIAVFNGHAHGYEHFIEHGLHWITTGGGGGPLQRIGGGRARRSQPPDQFSWPAGTRRFLNYCLLHVDGPSIDVEVRGLTADGGVRVVDRVQAYARRPGASSVEASARSPLEPV